MGCNLVRMILPDAADDWRWQLRAKLECLHVIAIDTLLSTHVLKSHSPPFICKNIRSNPVQFDLNHELPRKRWLKVLWKRNYFWKQIGKIWHILFLLSWPILLEPGHASYILLLSSICSSCGASWKCLFNLFPLKGSTVWASSSTTSNAMPCCSQLQ